MCIILFCKFSTFHGSATADVRTLSDRYTFCLVLNFIASGYFVINLRSSTLSHGKILTGADPRFSQKGAPTLRWGSTRDYRPQTKFGARSYVYRCVSVHRGDAWSGGCLLPGGVCSRRGLLLGVCSQGGCLLLGGTWSWGVPGGDPPTATAAGGTHPTGMHSCFTKFSEKLHEI